MKKINAMEMTVDLYHQALKAGTITTQDLVAYYLTRIDQYDQKGPKLNSIIIVNPNVLMEAEAKDREYKINGLTGPLHGVPVLLKDNVDTSDMPTTGGSLSLKDFVPDEDAFIVKALKAAGAIILAKTNLHEFAIWGETISSILGQTINPYNLERTPGGSSGGTGAAIASNFGLVGIGTDTINSVRSPASANNLVGIRPTIGLVSRSGIIPYSYTQDTAGPITRTVTDAVKVLDAISGYDSDDSVTAWSVGRKSELYSAHLIAEGLKGKRIGILKQFFGKIDLQEASDLHEETNQAVNHAIKIMAAQGAIMVALDELFDSEHLVKNVSVHLHDLKDHLNIYLSKLPERAGVHSVQEIMDSGLYHKGIEENLIKASQLSTGTDAYNKRLIARLNVQENLMKLMADYDLDALIYPHQKQLVCKIGESQNERNGVLGSVTGFPAICMPAGFSCPSESAPIGTPIGLELLGRPFSEGVLIEIAYAYEQAASMRKIPPFASDQMDYEKV